jgi:hypothetical protein
MLCFLYDFGWDTFLAIFSPNHPVNLLQESRSPLASESQTLRFRGMEIWREKNSKKRMNIKMARS